MRALLLLSTAGIAAAAVAKERPIHHVAVDDVATDEPSQPGIEETVNIIAEGGCSHSDDAEKVENQHDMKNVHDSHRGADSVVVHSRPQVDHAPEAGHADLQTEQPLLKVPAKQLGHGVIEQETNHSQSQGHGEGHEVNQQLDHSQTMEETAGSHDMDQMEGHHAPLDQSGGHHDVKQAEGHEMDHVAEHGMGQTAGHHKVEQGSGHPEVEEVTEHPIEEALDGQTAPLDQTEVELTTDHHVVEETIDDNGIEEALDQGMPSHHADNLSGMDQAAGQHEVEQAAGHVDHVDHVEVEETISDHKIEENTDNNDVEEAVDHVAPLDQAEGHAEVDHTEVEPTTDHHVVEETTDNNEIEEVADHVAPLDQAEGHAEVDQTHEMEQIDGHHDVEVTTDHDIEQAPEHGVTLDEAEGHQAPDLSQPMEPQAGGGDSPESVSPCIQHVSNNDIGFENERLATNEAFNGGEVPFAHVGPNGPNSWQGTCRTGMQQSPVDISSKYSYVSTLRGEEIQLRLEDDVYRKVLIENLGWTVQIRPQGTLKVEGVQYSLRSVQFRAMSEHTIERNVYPMEAQFNCQSADGKLAIVVILLDFQGFGDLVSPFVTKVLDAFSKVPRAGDRAAVEYLEVMELTRHLAGSAFYKYVGSLTAPPCTEGVAWYVADKPLYIQGASWQGSRSVMKYNSRLQQGRPGDANVACSGCGQ